MSDEDVVTIKKGTAKAYFKAFAEGAYHIGPLTRAVLAEIEPQLAPKWTVTWAEPSREWLVRVNGELIARFAANRNHEAWQYVEFRESQTPAA